MTAVKITEKNAVESELFEQMDRLAEGFDLWSLIDFCKNKALEVFITTIADGYFSGVIIRYTQCTNGSLVVVRCGESLVFIPFSSIESVQIGGVNK